VVDGDTAGVERCVPVPVADEQPATTTAVAATAAARRKI